MLNIFSLMATFGLGVLLGLIITIYLVYLRDKKKETYYLLMAYIAISFGFLAAASQAILSMADPYIIQLIGHTMVWVASYLYIGFYGLLMLHFTPLLKLKNKYFFGIVILVLLNIFYSILFPSPAIKTQWEGFVYWLEGSPLYFQLINGFIVISLTLAVGLYIFRYGLKAEDKLVKVRSILLSLNPFFFSLGGLGKWIIIPIFSEMSLLVVILSGLAAFSAFLGVFFPLMALFYETKKPATK